ncbi:uncharacterized protein LOC107764424 isoform X4 [Nicotiana tabacum]|uniref:Uncharacterized protein LOC107764424 isoform X4 n=1 Tax=Nicotiana tabacum TaxID=4097 RepID=A0AC58UCT1_TOBAC
MAVAMTHFTILWQPQLLLAPSRSRSQLDACSICTRKTFSSPSGKNRSNHHHFQHTTNSKYGILNCVCCSTDSTSRRGFGGPNDGNTKKGKNSATARRQAKGIVRPQRLALKQKKAEEEKAYGAIDYDAPIESESTTIGLGTKIGVGAAVIVFGLVFALGDFLPSGSVSPTEEISSTDKRIAEDERANLLKTLQQIEATLASSPEDSISLEGAAVTLAQLGEYNRASSLLEDLIKKKPSDPDVYRLLGEVKYELKDYEGSATAFRMSCMVSGTIDFGVLRGLTNALIAAKKPDEAVQMLLASRKRLNEEKTIGSSDGTKKSAVKSKSDVDPIQGIILKENGNVGDAERMFIQARFFAPENAKALVDKYSK